MASKRVSTPKKTTCHFPDHLYVVHAYDGDTVYAYGSATEVAAEFGDGVQVGIYELAGVAVVNTAEQLILVDRTRVVTDWRCPRARYWAFEHGGRGVSPVQTAEALDLGIRVHEALAAFVCHEELDSVVAIAVLGLDPEMGALVEGLIRGWARVIWPALRAEYDVVAVEQECVYDVGSVRVMAKPDIILRRREDGTHWYFEWKTTGTLKPEWFAQWQRAPQLWVGCRAAKQTLGLDVAGCIVQALHKGYRRADAQGVSRQQSPFCWLYRRSAGTDIHGQPLVEYSTEYQRGREWSRVPTWEEPGGVKAVVDVLPVDVLQAQFPQTPPFFVQDDLVERWVRQMVARELIIAQAQRDELDSVFPQHFDQCQPVFGSPCAYRDCCFIPHIGADPVASGLYVWREPHHTTETVGGEEAA